MPVAKPNRQPMQNELRSVRIAAGLSRQALADLVGVNVQTIGALERGHYSPSLYLGLLIARALGVSINRIFWLDPEDTSLPAPGVGTGSTADAP